jgi:acyl-CoA synthetase (AMP-forming)/AMP-acid ligase II
MKSICAALALAAAVALPVNAASPPPLGAAERAALITTLARDLEDDYVFPDRAIAAANELFAAQKSGTYDADTDPDAFAKALTNTLAGVLHDKHVRVEYSPDVLPKDGDDAASKREEYGRERTGWAEQNFGLFKAVRLRANVGYLDVRAFQTRR